MIRFRPTRRCRCAHRGALRLRKSDAYSLLLASGSEKIGQNSAGRSDGDRRWRSIIRFDRRTDFAYPSEDLFGLSESLVRRGDFEVLINILLRQLVRRDQIEPIIAAGEGGEFSGCVARRLLLVSTINGRA